MKEILIKYTTEIPIEYFDKFCKQRAVGKKDAITYLRESAIKAGEKEIDRVLMSLDTFNK